MTTIQDRVNQVLSKLYKQPVVGGFTNTGWAVIRSADDRVIVDGGLGRSAAPLAVEILETASKLTELLDGLEVALDSESVILE